MPRHQRDFPRRDESYPQAAKKGSRLLMLVGLLVVILGGIGLLQVFAAPVFPTMTNRALGN